MATFTDEQYALLAKLSDTGGLDAKKELDPWLKAWNEPKPLSWTPPDKDAERRLPRTYSSLDTAKKFDSPYTLDFCFWLARNFDGLVAAINGYKLFEFMDY